ncbi:MAG TPA: hypothetical protein VHL34_06740 [Rhizomicrobium sp.]|jgi:hypothetical protein|nr:hypothetical protein [Rhizomicrobium sp.]
MLSKFFKTAAVAGLTGLGISAAMAQPADAASYRRCDAAGCYRVNCDWRGYCYRTGGYYSSGYVAPPPAYATGYFDPYYEGEYYYRPMRVCDRFGCHYVRHREPRVSVGVGLRF